MAYRCMCMGHARLCSRWWTNTSCNPVGGEAVGWVKCGVVHRAVRVCIRSSCTDGRRGRAFLPCLCGKDIGGPSIQVCMVYVCGVGMGVQGSVSACRGSYGRVEGGGSKVDHGPVPVYVNVRHTLALSGAMVSGYIPVVPAGDIRWCG